MIRQKESIRNFLLGLWIAAILIPVSGFGDPLSGFQEGNALYQQGKFDEALEAYQKILDQGFENGPLHYNIGNCHYKMGRIAKAILHYEKAGRFMPRDEDLKANLLLANLAVVDKIEPMKPFFLVSLLDGFRNLLPVNGYLVLVLSLYVLFMVCLILFIIGRKRIYRTIFRTGIGFGALFILFGLGLLSRISRDRNLSEAVIMAGSVQVMSAPGEEGIEVFQLHEGTKVRLDNQAGEWVEIVLADGKVGWVRTEILEEI